MIHNGSTGMQDKIAVIHLYITGSYIKIQSIHKTINHNIPEQIAQHVLVWTGWFYFTVNQKSKYNQDVFVLI